MTSDSILGKGIGIEIYICRDIRVNAHLDEIRQHSREGKVQFKKCENPCILDSASEGRIIV